MCETIDTVVNRSAGELDGFASPLLQELIEDPECLVRSALDLVTKAVQPADDLQHPIPTKQSPNDASQAMRVAGTAEGAAATGGPSPGAQVPELPSAPAGTPDKAADNAAMPEDGTAGGQHRKGNPTGGSRVPLS